MLRIARILAVVGLALPLSAPLRAQGSSGFTPAEKQELMSHRLTMDNIKKVAVASDKLAELGNDPKLEEAMNREDATSLSDAIEKMNAFPPIRGAIEASGLTVKEFALTTIELASTRAAVKLKAMGGNAARATAHLPTSPQNLQFYAAHEAEIEPLAAKIERSGDDSPN